MYYYISNRMYYYMVLLKDYFDCFKYKKLYDKEKQRCDNLQLENDDLNFKLEKFNELNNLFISLN